MFVLFIFSSLEKMSSTEKKPRLVSVNPILSNSELIQRFRNAYTSRSSIDEKGLCIKEK